MSDKPLPFVVNDRRKFTAEGEARPDAPPSETKSRPEAEKRPEPKVTPISTPAERTSPDFESAPEYQTERHDPSPAPDTHNPNFDVEHSEADAAPGDLGGGTPGGDDLAPYGEGDLPPAPTAEQLEQSRIAFDGTAERLDLAIRASNPGMDHPPAISFDTFVNSLYMQGIYQLGGATQEGQQPQVDLLGASGTVRMLGLLGEKCAGNLQPAESRLLETATFELRMAYLEITQALARQAQQRATGQPGGAQPGNPFGGQPGARPGPSIVR